MSVPVLQNKEVMAFLASMGLDPEVCGDSEVKVRMNLMGVVEAQLQVWMFLTEAQLAALREMIAAYDGPAKIRANVGILGQWKEGNIERHTIEFDATPKDGK